MVVIAISNITIHLIYHSDINYSSNITICYKICIFKISKKFLKKFIPGNIV